MTLKLKNRAVLYTLAFLATAQIFAQEPMNKPRNLVEIMLERERKELSSNSNNEEVDAAQTLFDELKRQYESIKKETKDKMEIEKRNGNNSRTDKLECLHYVLLQNGFSLTRDKLESGILIADEYPTDFPIAHSLKKKAFHHLLFVDLAQELTDIKVVRILPKYSLDQHLGFMAGKTILKYNENGRTIYYDPLGITFEDRSLTEDKIKEKSGSPLTLITTDQKYTVEYTPSTYITQPLIEKMIYGR